MLSPTRKAAAAATAFFLGGAILLLAQNQVTQEKLTRPPVVQSLPPGAPPLVTSSSVPSSPGDFPPLVNQRRSGVPLPPPPAAGGLPAPPGPVGVPAIRLDLTKAATSVQTVMRAKPYLRLSNVWATRGPRGDLDLKVALMYEGAAVGVLHFDPATGTVLPRGYHTFVMQQSVPDGTVMRRARTLLAQIDVLKAAEYREPEACWVVPLAYQGAIVAEIRVSKDGTGLIPDYPATQEMQVYGR